MTAIVWFRRDLRVHDHAALTSALLSGREVLAVFVFDPALMCGSWSSANRNWFLVESIRALDESLRARGSRLHVRTGDPCKEIAQIAAEVGASDVYVSKDYAPYGIRRDARVRESLGNSGVRFHEMPGVLAVEPEDLVAPGSKPAHSYSQFKKRWDAAALRHVLSAPLSLPPPYRLSPGALPTVQRPSAAIVTPGEDAARDRLDRFLAGSVHSYAADRDTPAFTSATSRISQDLRFGLLSPAEVIARARQRGEAAAKFVSEIAWREFYFHLLWRHPQLLRQPLDRRFEAFPWRSDPESFAAWCEGRTGYPMVDAAIRELLATGYMHNRARMVAASFLVKHLRIDWREGERFFMRHLVDGDPANNNGGWQWTAGCGTDAQPFFRIFNPILQGKKFDPAGEYVRRWLPALRDVPAAFVHSPWEMPAETQQLANCVVGRDYPAPIVNHAEARQLALDAFATLKRSPVGSRERRVS
ncbi:MAG: deoxyribodipyrimidine photo-lyase [Dehalococcoidia bacterium]